MKTQNILLRILLFGCLSAAASSCDLTESNTYENQNNVVFRPSKAKIAKKNAKYTFPRYSYTVITLKK